MPSVYVFHQPQSSGWWWAAAAIDTSAAAILLGKIYAIVLRGCRPDIVYPDSIKSVRAATMLIVRAKDTKEIVELNKKAFKQLKNAMSKVLVMVPNAGHLFEETGSIEKLRILPLNGI